MHPACTDPIAGALGSGAERGSPPTGSAQLVDRAAAGRVVALDAFRGITVAAMILVNSPGAGRHEYAFLQHATWNGWLPADLIFPAFLFIAGMAIPLSFARQEDRGALRGKILTRMRIILGLGLLLNALPYFDWDVLRIPGVLQRIALCYGAAALLVLYFDVRAQAAAAALLLIGYWVLLTLVPVPGHGAGVLQPGADLGAWLDVRLMDHHLRYANWDPEGLLSTLPAIATTLGGVLAGHWLRSAADSRRCLVGMLVGAVAAIVLGEIWGLVFPINKNLWTSSYAVFSDGAALLGFALCYWLIDVAGHRLWSKPFVVYGTNAILAYGLSSLLTKLLSLIHVRSGAQSVTLQLYLFDRLFAPLAGPPLASLLYALSYTAVWFAVVAALYRRGMFVKI